jgi:archaeal flagellar protein FlaJ
MSLRSFSYATFGFLGKSYRYDKELSKDLNRAHMEMAPDAYVAWAAMVTLIVTVVSLIIAVLVYVVFIPIFEDVNTDPADDEPYTMDPGFKQLILFGIILGIPACTILYFKEISFGGFKLKGNAPGMKAKQRGKKADLYLPHAASFVAAMAASNATLEKIFLSLSTQKAKKVGFSYYISKAFGQPLDRDVFPVISDEASAIYRDAVLLGVDTLTAIQTAVDRAPSPWMAEFFQGISSTISSGGNLKLYFLNSAERFMEDIKQQQRETLDQLATQAEMFVTVAVAMPIFLIIILIITIWISTDSGSGSSSLSTLYMVIFMLVPLLHFIFAFMTYSNIRKFSI